MEDIIKYVRVKHFDAIRSFLPLKAKTNIKISEFPKGVLHEVYDVIYGTRQPRHYSRSTNSDLLAIF